MTGGLLVVKRGEKITYTMAQSTSTSTPYDTATPILNGPLK